MAIPLVLQTADCFGNRWKQALGVYWGLNGAREGRYAYVVMSRTGGNCPASGREKKFYLGRPDTFDEFSVRVYKAGDSLAKVMVWKTGEEIADPDYEYTDPDKSWIDPDKPDEPTMTKAQIISNHSDKLGYAVGDIIKSECVVKNIGGAGTIFLTVGLGYIDSSNMIFLTGFPTTDQLFLNYQQMYTFREDVKVDITDYYRQRGIGWAYLQQQMYLFFLVGHKTDGDLVWDTERHIKIYIDEPGGFKDPTDLDETIIGDIIPDDIDDIIGGFGGLGGLKWVYDKTKDIEHIPDWIADMLRKEPEEEQPDLMPFIYIGFAGLIGYLLVRSQ